MATQSANVTLALGASPIMATEAQEMEDLAKVSGALLINIGTLKSEVKTGMIRAGMRVYAIYVVKQWLTSIPGHFANVYRKPVVLDPVGMGATTFRKETVKGM